MDLLGYTFICDHDETKERGEVKELLEDEGKFMVKYVNGGEKLMNYTDLINIFNSINEDGAKMLNFEDIAGHKKLPGDHWKVNVLWYIVEET